MANICTAKDTESQTLKLPTKNNAEISRNSFGVYAKLGFLGYGVYKEHFIEYYDIYYTNQYSYVSYDYTFTPGLALYYSYRANNGIGVEAALEYEYNALLANSDRSIMYNFFTPAIYFSWLHNKQFSRIGIGYDIGLPYTYRYYSDYTFTSMYQGIALLASDEWKINNKNAIGMFVKVSLRWLNTNFNNISSSDFNHVLFSFGLSYRFNMGF